MNASTFKIEEFDARLQKAIHTADMQPVIVTEKGLPAYVIRPFVDDDLADEIIESDPEFLASIQRARQQKAAGQVFSLAEVRAQYELEDAAAQEDSPLPPPAE